MTGENLILPAYVRSLTVRDRDFYLKRLTLMDKTRLADPYTLTQSLDDLTGFLRLSDSHLTCIVKTNSPCLSSHEHVYTFQFQQATIFTAILLFQPQLITTMYIQLQMIKHIKLSVCCFTHRHYFIHNIVMRCIRNL